MKENALAERTLSDERKKLEAQSLNPEVIVETTEKYLKEKGVKTDYRNFSNVYLNKYGQGLSTDKTPISIWKLWKEDLAKPLDVYITNEQFSVHSIIVWKTGDGKSVQLLALIKTALSLGNGVLVLDPHGDLTQDTLLNIPKGREKDVVLIDFGDENLL